MPIRPILLRRTPPEDLEKWDEIKHFDQSRIVLEQHDLDSTDTITSEEKDWTRSFCRET